jgi:aryl-alcohol dehydrogenase-like predicted oxidoreductase
MEIRACGNSGLQLSALGLGCWAFGGGEYWGESDQENVNRLVQRAYDLGVTYFDTAEAYNEGRSEQFLGEAIKPIPRDRIVIGSKIAPSNTRPATLVEHCEASLARLGTDYVDLYMIHWPIHPQAIRHHTDDEDLINNPPSLEEAVHTLLRLQEQGKIRYLGVSNFGVTRLEEILQVGGDYVADQLGYSLLTRAAEMEILPYCRQKNVGVIVYMVLMQGLLADRWRTFEEIPEWQKRTRHFNCQRTPLCRHGEEGAEEETLQALDRIRIIAKECGMPMSDVALNWAVANQGVSSVLVGTQNVQRLEANVKGVAEPLPPEVIEKLNLATEPLKQKLGPCLDLFESVQNDRTK